MSMFSRNEILVGTASLLASIALTTVSTTASGVSYTANGKTDARTAQLFNKLLKNSKYLQVETLVRPSSPRSHSPYDLAVNYRVTGKTDVKTARKLIRLFRTSKHIEVIVDVHQHLASKNIARNPYQNNQQRMNVGSMPVYTPNYPAVYVQSANNPYNWYPVAMWKRVAVPATGSVAINKTSKVLTIAGQ